MAKRSNDINLSLNISGEEKIRQLTAALRDADAEIEKLQSQLEAARAEAQQFQDAFDNLKFNTGVAALEEELSRFRSTARESVSEFSSFLKAANLTDGIPQYDDRFSELFRKIEDGSMTASQAIAKVKTDFAYLMQENFSKSGGAFDSQMVQQFSASLERLGQTVDVVLQKLESIETNGVKSMTGGAMSTGISDITQMFSQIMQAAQSMSETASTSVDSISNLVGAIGRFASIDGSKLLSVSQAFRSLSELHSGSFGTKSVDNIISLAERLRKLNEQGSFRLRFDLSGLKDFKVSSTIHHLTDFINNLSEDKISVLERLQQINLSNFNSANFKIDRGSVSGLKELLTILNTSGFDAKSVSDNAAISKALTIAKDAESVRNAMSSMSAQTQASMTGTLTTLSAEQNQLAALNTGYLAHAQTVNEAAAAENNKAMMSQLLAILLEREMASMQNSTASAQEHANVVVEDASAVQSASSAYSEHAQLLLSDANASESSIAAARNRAQALLSAVSATQQSAQADSAAATASEQLRNAIQNLIQAEQLGVITGQQFATTVQALYAAYSQMGSATQQIYPMLTASADAEAQGAASAQIYRDAIIASAQARQQNTAAASAMNGAIEGEFHDIETATVAHTENAQAMLSEASAADALTSAMTAASGAAQEGEASERQYHDALAQVSNVLKNVQNAKAKLEGQKGGIYRAEYAELTELESKLQTLKSSGMSTPFNELMDSISEIRHGLSDALQQMNLFTISEKEAASASKEFDQQRAAIKNLESLYNQLQSAQEKMQGTHSIMEVQTLVELQGKLRDIIAAGHEGTMSAENLQKAYSTLSSVFSSVMTSGNALISASKDRANAEREEAAAAKEAAAALKEKEAAEATRQSTMRQVNSLIVQCTNAEKKYALASKLPSAKDNYRGIQETKRQLQELSVQLENGSISMAEAKARLNDLSTAFSNNSTALKTNTSFLGNYMTSGLGMLKSRLMYTFGLANVVMKSIQGLKKMISTAVELDTAMNQLQIVTRASGDEMDQYGERVTAMAMETAQSTKDLIDATTVYARLGYDMDESAVLAKYTAMLQGVGI